MPGRPHAASPELERFALLCALLDDLGPGCRAVQLSLDRIAQLVGAPLPPAAWRDYYWSNSRAAKYNWRRHGFRARLDRTANTVTFTRMATADAPTRGSSAR